MPMECWPPTTEFHRKQSIGPSLETACVISTSNMKKREFRGINIISLHGDLSDYDEDHFFLHSFLTFKFFRAIWPLQTAKLRSKLSASNSMYSPSTFTSISRRILFAIPLLRLYALWAIQAHLIYRRSFPNSNRWEWHVQLPPKLGRITVAPFEEGGSVLKRLLSIGRPLYSGLASTRKELQQPPRRALAKAECCSVNLFQARSVCLQLPFKSLHRTFLAVNFSPNESLKYFHILHFHHNSCTFMYLPYVLNFHFVPAAYTANISHQGRHTYHTSYILLCTS